MVEVGWMVVDGGPWAPGQVRGAQRQGGVHGGADERRARAAHRDDTGLAPGKHCADMPILALAGTHCADMPILALAGTHSAYMSMLLPAGKQMKYCRGPAATFRTPHILVRPPT